MAKTKQEILNPMRITDPKTGETYVLEYNRTAVKFAEARGFKIAELMDYPQTNIPDLFWYAFRMHHPEVAKVNADRIFDELGGLTAEELGRLAQLYAQTNETLINESGERKNSRLTVEL